MESGVFTTSANDKRCIENEKTCFYGHKTKIFLTARRIKFVAMDILGSQPQKTQGNQQVSVFADRYSQLASAISTLETISAHIANLFFDLRIGSFCIPAYL